MRQLPQMCRLVPIAAAALVVPGATYVGQGFSPAEYVTPGVNAADDTPAWARAQPGRILQFPADHASHPEYRIEWWYYTGNLTSGTGRRVGYQLTFFRIGVDPAPRNPSRWTVRDLHMAHLAVTDVAGRRHVAAERLNRTGVGWAGAAAGRYRVWNENWSAMLVDGRHHLKAATAAPPIDLNLVLDEGKPPALHGDRGFSQKGSEPGNASHYYSLTRMPTRGTIVLEGERHEVAGASWMDHEFGSSFLEPGQTGWDWFSLQLQDGSELMVYQLRGTDGTVDPRSSGTLVDRTGQVRALPVGSFTLTSGRRWTSRASGASYPVEWRIRIPAEDLDLAVRAAVDWQEMHTGLASGVTYWEGAIDVSGRRQGRPATGVGYLEMTGYSGRPMGELLGQSR